MTTINGIYQEFLLGMLGGTSSSQHGMTDLDVDQDVEIMLYDSIAGGNVDATSLSNDEDYADVVAGLVGTAPVIAPGNTVSAMTNAAKFTHTIATWNSVNGSDVDGLIYFKDNAGASPTSGLICCITASVSPNGGNITFTPHADGVFNFTTT
jgi:hypothetical protein